MIVSLGCMRVAMQAVWDYCTDFASRGLQAEKDFEVRVQGHPTEDFNKFIGVPKIRELEGKYFPKDMFREKYEGSEGLKGEGLGK